MKKTAISLAVAALAIAPMTSQAAASLYGSIRLIANSPAGDDRDISIDNSGSRFGLRGSEELANGMKIGGRYEFGVAADVADVQDNNRLSYVSIEGGFGEVQVGRVWSTYWNANGRAWQNNEFGGEGNTTTFRLSDSIKWTKGFGPATVSALVQMEDGVQRTQGSLGFSMAGFDVGLGLDQVDGGDDGEDQTNTALGLSYSLNGIGLNAVVNNNDDGVNDATTGYNVNGVYSAGNNTFIVSYGDPNTDADDDEAVSFEVSTKLGDMSKAFLSVQNSDPGTGVKIGLRHDW